MGNISKKLEGAELDGKEVGRIEAIIRSMTLKERRNPNIINGSRRRRIALGSGVRVQDVNKLLKNFEDSKKMMKKMQGMLVFEKKYWQQGIKYVAGCDEAGRGPLAGPLVVAAVILPEGIFIRGLNDSKKLSAVKREKLYAEVYEKAISITVNVVGPKDIDELNIYQATKISM